MSSCSGRGEAGQPQIPSQVLVYDMGGGTFDVSLLEIEAPSQRKPHDPTKPLRWSRSKSAIVSSKPMEM